MNWLRPNGEKTSLNKKQIKIARALISVFDKSGVLELAQFLEKINVEILSTGGTEKFLKIKISPLLILVIIHSSQRLWMGA